AASAADARPPAAARHDAGTAAGDARPRWQAVAAAGHASELSGPPGRAASWLQPSSASPARRAGGARARGRARVPGPRRRRSASAREHVAGHLDGRQRAIPKARLFGSLALPLQRSEKPVRPEEPAAAVPRELDQLRGAPAHPPALRDEAARGGAREAE